MFYKTVLVLCAQALLIQGISAQYGAPCAWSAPAACEYVPAASLSASNGPGVAVATGSPAIPAGISVLSENAYEGTLACEGALPFLGTVSFEGVLPTAGAGVVAYNCGSGVVGITSEDAIGAGITGPLGYGGIGPLAGAPLAGAALAGVPLAGPLSATPLAGWGTPYATVDQANNPATLSASNGAGLVVSSSSPVVPAGVAVQSDNIYEGELAVGGAVPFLGTVTIEGSVPNAGAGAVAYGCGNGAVRITAEDIGTIGFNRPRGYGWGLGPIGYSRSGCGCGAIY